MKRTLAICTIVFMVFLVGVPAIAAEVVLTKDEKVKATAIRIIAGDTISFAILNDSRAAQDFIATLPRTLSMQRLFDREYYTVLPMALSKEDKSQESYELGDIAFWTSGNYFGVLYSYVRPKLSSPIIVIGKIISDLATFDSLERNVEMHFEVDE